MTLWRVEDADAVRPEVADRPTIAALGSVEPSSDPALPFFKRTVLWINHPNDLWRTTLVADRTAERVEQVTTTLPASVLSVPPAAPLFFTGARWMNLNEGPCIQSSVRWTGRAVCSQSSFLGSTLPYDSKFFPQARFGGRPTIWRLKINFSVFVPRVLFDRLSVVLI